MMKLIIIFIVLLAVFNAGSINWRIVGGKNARDGQFPWVVSIRSYGRHFCGGSIINKRWILTAAHCLTNPVRLSILAGTNNKIDELSGKIYAVERTLEHVNFSSVKYINDIGLLRLAEEIVFSKKVQPISLYTLPIGRNINVTLSGWGRLSTRGVSPNMLQFINAKTISTKECITKMNDKKKQILDSEICTIMKIGQGACKGDSGGPLIYKGTLAGVMSWGDPCSKGKPDVYTRISAFIDWIILNIN